MSIRGSGLSRSYGNRGINLYMDSIPINTADGLFDLFEIDPTAYRYVEVYKGANALRYGANALGGAINFVTPTGRDADAFDGRIDIGSFGYLKGQAATGASQGPYDYFITASGQRFDGYREHSDGNQERLSSNFGYQISADAETRFYVNANSWHSRLPGEVSKSAALRSPRAANDYFVLLDQQRNIDSARLANKTTLHFGPTTLDLGLFGVYRHVRHPIYQWLDFRVLDYGGFSRLTDERNLAGRRNRLIGGVNIHNGEIDNKQYQNLPEAEKGAHAASNVDTSKNTSAYLENAYFLLERVALVAGTQFDHASRERRDRFKSDGNQSGSRDFDIWSPKIGLLWEIDRAWQVFANVSRSAEVPTYDVNSFGTPASSTVDAQTAVTYEIGTRGHRQNFIWDISFYRTSLHHELQCLTNPASPGACTITNADRTIHQGIELGLSAALLDSIIHPSDSLWFNAAYTYSDFFFDHDAIYGHNHLAGVPPQYLRAELLYRHPSGFAAGPNLEWVPRVYYADNANQLSVDPYTQVNFRISYDPGQHWSGYIEGRNLTDKHYISSTAVVETADANSALFNPGTGRALYGGLRYQW